MIKDYLAEMEWTDRREREDYHIQSMYELGFNISPSSYWDVWNPGSKDISNLNLTKILEENSIDEINPTGDLREEYRLVQQSVAGTKNRIHIHNSRLLDVISKINNNVEPVYISNIDKNWSTDLKWDTSKTFIALYHPEALFSKVSSDELDPLYSMPGYSISNLIFNHYSMGYGPSLPAVKMSKDFHWSNGIIFDGCLFNKCILHLDHSRISACFFVNCDINIYVEYDIRTEFYSLPTYNYLLSILHSSTFENCTINIINRRPFLHWWQNSAWDSLIKKSDYELRISYSKFKNSKIYCDESLKDIRFIECLMSNTIFDATRPANFLKGIKFTESDVDTFSLYTRDEINKIIDGYFDH